MIENVVRFEIDEIPIGLLRPERLDYIGRFVGGAAIEPLLRFDDSRGVTESLLLERDVAGDGLHHQFRVRQGHQWSDGHFLIGEEIGAFLQRQSQHCYWAHHLSCVTEIHGHGDLLEIRLRLPINQLPELLCADELAPAANNAWGRDAASAGPYVFRDYDNECSTLSFTPNEYYAGWANRPRLEFGLQRDVRRVEDRFRSGSVDVTCSTMFPFSSLMEWAARPEFHSAPSAIWV